MNTRQKILTLLVFLWGIVAVNSAFGQTTYTWIGAADGTNLATAGNWTTNGTDPAATLPDGTFQDIVKWDGLTKSNLVLTYGSSSWPGTGSGTQGIIFVLTSNQTNSVQIISPIPLSAPLPMFAITNNSPNAALN